MTFLCAEDNMVGLKKTFKRKMLPLGFPKLLCRQVAKQYFVLS